MNGWWKLGLSIIALTLILGFTAKEAYDRGWLSGDAHARGELKPRIDALESEKAEAARQSAALREKARIEANAAAARLQDAETRINSLEKERNDAISSRASAVRRALSAQLTRLLNEQRERAAAPSGDGAPAAAAPVDASERRPSAPAADSGRPSADDGSGSSERVVAFALNERGTLYQRCRARFFELVDYVNGITAPVAQ